MINLGITFLPNEKTHASTAEIGTTINPTPVRDNVTDFFIDPFLTTVSTGSNFEVSVL